MYWKKKGRSNVFYCSEVIKLDIETAWNHDELDPITWMVSARVIFNGESLLFRRPSDLMAWYNSLVKEYNLTFLKRIITIIHNASYDLSYLLPYIREYLPKERPYGLFDSPNKVITYRQGCFEFRCTYRLTNESLAKWTEEQAVEHPKKVGMYDYDKILYQDSELSEKEVLYGEYDCLGMGEAWEKQLRLYNDDVTTAPLTATGYIRRILRKASRRDPGYRNTYFLDNKLTLEQYDFCLKSFSGGYVHVNRNIRAQLLDQEVFRAYGCDRGIMRDFRSFYPKHLIQSLLPVGKPRVYFDIHDKIHREHKRINLDDILNLYPQYSSITKFRVYDLEVKGWSDNDDSITMPIFQVSKIEDKKGVVHYAEDNGRLLKLFSGSFSTYMDNHTMKIFKQQYKGKIVIEKVIIFENGYLPEVLQEPINDLFLKKTDLGNIYWNNVRTKGQFDYRTVASKINLDVQKKLLNACFGCFAQKPIKVNYAINETGKMSEDYRRGQLEEYYGSRNNFLAFQIGAFLPSIAKAELFEYIDLIGQDKILYCDTDSLFYMSNDDIEKKVETLNEEKKTRSKFVIDKDGNKVLYEAFDVKARFKAFKGLHSKCYGYVSDTGDPEKDELKLTLAGVPERTIIGMNGDTPIYMTREEELSGYTKADIKKGRKKRKDPVQCLDRLETDFTFKVNTGVTVKYVKQHISTIDINGHMTETAGGAIIIPLPEKMIKDETKLDGFDYEIVIGETEGVIDID